jgi:prepilin-type N-terminal cleavage/methylation domain-containing protein
MKKKIRNDKDNYINLGFTLIEVLVVISVFTVLSTVIVAILFTVIRGTKKSDSITVVRQNGEYAIDQIIKKIRFAKSLDYPSPAGGAPPECSSSGTTVSSVTITNLDLSQTVFSCPGSLTYPNNISLDGAGLTNSNSVIVTSCSFVCSQNSGGPLTIGVYFDLTKVSSSGLPEENTTIPFQSSVTLRNDRG